MEDASIVLLSTQSFASPREIAHSPVDMCATRCPETVQELYVSSAAFSWDASAWDPRPGLLFFPSNCRSAFLDSRRSSSSYREAAARGALGVGLAAPRGSTPPTVAIPECAGESSVSPGSHDAGETRGRALHAEHFRERV